MVDNRPYIGKACMLADHITGQRFIGIFVDGLGGQGVYFFDKGLKIIFQCLQRDDGPADGDNLAQISLVIKIGVPTT